jgi:ABC-2 type transport system permease protein
MLSIFSHALKRSIGQILGWGLSLATLAAYLVAIYGTFADQQAQMIELIKSYPEALMASFGGVEQDIFSPAGYTNFGFFSYMPLVMGIYALLIGSGLLAGDEENGRLDLLLSYPVKRAGICFGRLFAFVLSTLAILAIGWVGFVLTVPSSELDASAGALALPFVSLFGITLFYGCLAFLLSMLLPSRRLAAQVSALVLVASFFMTTLARINPDLENIEKFNPFHYYQGGQAITGLDEKWFLGFLGLSVLFSLIAWWRFERRDVRVGGEGSWGISMRKPGNRKGVQPADGS